MTDEEVRFIYRAAEKSILAFHHFNDPMIVGLIEKGFMNAEPQNDPEHAMLSLTGDGRAVIDLIEEERLDPPP